ncbi:unnamed protein product [Schistosoma mattheei]|uniref:Uncharacterized protein n=1 Tax=Schistosoma mattheei TaxID=31246 RepID=A0A183PZB6_9TREM|nr:unnamed protein product [Schistosoma mattheei]
MTKLEKHFVNCADAFILVYDISDSKSFSSVQSLKQDIDKYREKRDLCIVLSCHKVDKPKDATLDSTEVSRWSQSEKGIAHQVIGGLDVFSSVFSSPPSFTLSFLSDFQIYKSQKFDRNQIHHIYLAGIRKLT